MLFIVRPAQCPSDRLRTSFTVARSSMGFAGGRAAGGCTPGGGGSGSDASCGTGFGRGVNGTGARLVSTVSGAPDFTAAVVVVPD